MGKIKGSAPKPGPFAFQFTSLLLHAGIVRWIDVVELDRGLPVDLDHGLSGSGGIVMHGGVEVGETARPEGHHLAGVELISHAYFEGARKDGDVLPVRMGMRSDLVTVWHFQANSKVTRGSHGVAFENGQLRARRKKGRSRPVFHLVGREGVLGVHRLRGENSQGKS